MNDGIKDGVIGDARLCTYDPARIECKPGQSGSGVCLTLEQVVAAQRMYAGPHDSKGRQIGYQGGLMRGPELNWIGDYIDSPKRKAQYRDFIANVYRYIGFNPSKGLEWTLRDLDFDTDPQRLYINEALYRADNPDFRLFRNYGGKFIGFQGERHVGRPDGHNRFLRDRRTDDGRIRQDQGVLPLLRRAGDAPLLVRRRCG